MTLIKNLKHYKDILWLLYKYGQGNISKELSSDVNLPQVLKERGQVRGKAEDLVKDLEDLGPFYIKMGQIISAEAEFLPPEYEEALKKLEDKAEPMPYEDVEEVILKELNNLPEKIFKYFEKTPLSAASLGQVHFATLTDGKEVAVKIQRKDISNNILEQLDALETICTFLQDKTESGKRYHVIDKFQHLRTIFLNELDYLKEGNNLKILHENLKEYENLIVPLPVDEFSTSKVLTMDFIDGKKLTELTDNEKAKIDGEILSQDLFQAFLKQILVDGFFQMDPHPGNVKLTYLSNKPCLALFDLGMVSNIPFQMQGQIIQCLFAMSQGQELEVTNILISMGKKLPEFDHYLFKTKISDVLGNRELTISQLPMGKVVLKLAHIAAEAGLWLPIQFSNIGKTLLSLNPVLTALNPSFEPNTALKEQASDLLSKRLTRQVSAQSFYQIVLGSLDFFQQLPGNLKEIFNMLAQNDCKLKIQLLETETISKNFEKIANRITVGLILASLVISAALLMRVETSFKILGYPGFAMIMFLLAASGSFFLLVTILLADRKKN
ncbi:MAG TPA: AarF/UbiB family protein [Parachlamydiaceae bacterium]|nr:AarF/ABC1/UbiB kinase family protein [Nitrosopumilus sp.]HEV8052936.1 AarF/UbiB family protein [Parachlamydiaceae bacterium]